MSNKEKKYPEGHFVGMWMGICIAIFSGFGIPLSIVTENFGFFGIGPALGVAVGVAIGQSIENKYKQEGRIRPLSESEIKRKKNAVSAGIVILTLGVLISILLYFL
jgi:uncharacterized membrane protein (DUF441 family)